MISSLWIAKTGHDAQQTNMDVIANNLANVSTNGLSVSARCLKICCIKPFASRGTVFRTNHLPSGLQIGTGTPGRHGTFYSQATCRKPITVKTSRLKAGLFPGDVARWLISLYRDSSFQVDQNGQLVTAGGFQVQPAITIPANALVSPSVVMAWSA